MADNDEIMAMFDWISDISVISVIYCFVNDESLVSSTNNLLMITYMCLCDLNINRYTIYGILNG